MLNNKEYAILFKKIEIDNNIIYIPFDVVSGEYNETNNYFRSKNNIYNHLIYDKEVGFAFNEDITKIIKKNHLVPFNIAKKIILNYLNNYNFNKVFDQNGAPGITINHKKGDINPILLTDSIVMDFYRNNHPEIIVTDEEEKESSEIEENTTIDVKNTYEVLTKNISGQDKQIKQILTLIWKKHNNYDNNIPNSILINGENNTPKKQIFELLGENTNIPISLNSMLAYTDNNDKMIESLLCKLLDISNGNINKAQKGIIVIDDLYLITIDENNCEENTRLQVELIKLLNGLPFKLNYQGKIINFNTNNLQIILMGDFYKYDIKDIIVPGFSGEKINNKEESITRNDYIRNGLLPELVNSVQYTIELNKLCLKNYVETINSEYSSLTMAKKFFNNYGIELDFSDDVIQEIAATAIKRNHDINSINMAIEELFEESAFEIACNPDIYDKLIVTKDTIKDNKKYTLVRKNNVKSNKNIE